MTPYVYLHGRCRGSGLRLVYMRARGHRVLATYKCDYFYTILLPYYIVFISIISWIILQMPEDERSAAVLCSSSLINDYITSYYIMTLYL